MEKAAFRIVVRDAASRCGRGGVGRWRACRWRRAGQTDIRGLSTAGRAVRLERGRLSRVERRAGALLIAVSRVAPRAAVTETLPGRSGSPNQSGMVASDQHQPASSRATATLAITGRFLRTVNVFQRWCRRWLPAWPRARAAAGAWSHRACIVALGRYRGRWCQAASTSSRRAWVLQVLVIEP